MFSRWIEAVLSVQSAKMPRALLFVAIPLALLLGVMAFQFTYAIPQAERGRVETVTSFRIVQAASAVAVAIRDAERGQRGFLITSRDSYLTPYENAKERLPKLMAALQDATRESPEQQQQFLRLQADIATKMNELASMITAMRQSGFESAKTLVQTDLGRNSMDAISSDLAGISDAAGARLAVHLSRTQDANRRTVAAFVIGSILSGLAFIGGVALLLYGFGIAARAERILQGTLDSVREGVAALDGAGRLKAWNAPFCRFLGIDAGALKRDETIAINLGASSDTSWFVTKINELDVAAKRTGQPVLVNHRGSRGETLELFHNRVADGYVTTILDITEQRRAEEALRGAQKLEALGRMSGGVAHDFNNLLTIIVGSLLSLRRFVSDDKTALERLNMIGIAAERAGRLTKRLLAFGRHQPLEPEVVNLDQVMHEILPLVRRAVGESVAVECVSAGGLWNTRVDPTQFRSAVVNLAVNSRDAMPDGGRLTIEVSNAALDDVCASHHAEVVPGQYVLFAITDTGKGMDAATMALALDPFFTTKPPSQGTGLGLPEVYGFVKQSGGHLKLYSEFGEGTTVKIYIPCMEQQTTGLSSRVTHLAVTGRETILLVEDDEIVRLTMASMLEELGYKVLMAENGSEAIGLLRHGADVDLLLTDVVMPELGGRKLPERLREIRPSVKVLYTSGYTENAIVHNGQLDAGVELLSKPLRPSGREGAARPHERSSSK
jgi:signal transduction histidine kinase/CHASE3 domain sensor protein